MRSPRTLATILILALVVFAGSFGRAWSLGLDDGEHERFASALRRATELDARLDEEVARSRLGLVTHYDGLVRVSDAARETGADLDPLPAFVEGGDRDELRALIEDYRSALASKRELVEDFKREQAVLRNALSALPHNARRVVPALRAHEEGAARAEAVRELVTETMQLVLSPSAEREAAARARLAALRAMSEMGSPELDRGVGSVTLQADVALERRTAVERVVTRIMELDVAGRAGALSERYDAVHTSAVGRARAWWLVVLASMVALVLIVAAFVIARLRAERDREAQLALLKSRFVSMTSHEFRTPLSVILSSAELLEGYAESWSPEKRQLHLDRISDAGQGMTRMLDQVLLIGRAEAGMIELRPGPLRLPALVDAVVEEVRTLVGEDRLLEMDVDTTEDEVLLDERLLKHVLTNLLSNAFKYSDEGSTVTFEVTTDAGGVTFVIRDEGIGIPDDDLANVFTAFHRGGNAEAIPGTGLGLAVVKKSVDVHGGTMDVDSKAGIGTTFTVRVPFEGGEA